MRAVAIVLVVLGHVLLVLRFCVRGAVGWAIMSGYFGVEIFFVLSGFLIGGILLRNFSDDGVSGGTLGRFWCRRWLRTLPLYYLFVGVNLAINAALGSPSPKWVWNLVFLQNCTTPAGPFFTESWSLAIEEWFYLLAPVAIFLLARTGTPLKRAVLTTAIGGIVAATGWRMHVVASTNPDWLRAVRTVVTMRFDACMFGVFAAWWHRYAPASWNAWRSVKLIAGLLCLVGAGLMFRFLPVNGSFAARTHLFTLTSVGAMLCLPALAALHSVPGKLAGGATRLSQWSYALYLVNVPVFTGCSVWLAGHVHDGFRQPATAGWTAFTAVSLSLLASAALHYGYERPILRWRDRHVRATQEAADDTGAVDAGEVTTAETAAPFAPVAKAT
jgi:peptidoglycan/LPS O-acetylase OafA/YrhL